LSLFNDWGSKWLLQRTKQARNKNQARMQESTVGDVERTVFATSSTIERHNREEKRPSMGYVFAPAYCHFGTNARTNPTGISPTNPKVKARAS
jgi:hypothetical protein